MSMKTVNGFTIPLRELTEEEKTRDITWERFREFHYEAGVDFLDNTGEGNHLIFGGWLMAKFPQCSKQILEVCNNQYGTVLDYRDIEEFDYDEDKDIDGVYVQFAEFANQTEHLKARINEILIIVVEHYTRNT